MTTLLAAFPEGRAGSSLLHSCNAATLPANTREKAKIIMPHTKPVAPTKPDTAPEKPVAPAAPVGRGARVLVAAPVKRDNPYAREYANFLANTADHVLTVKVDDGLNRQMRVGETKTSIWSWHIITWPGYLTTVGDIADGFTFKRDTDMFKFFEVTGGSLDYYSDGAPSIDFRYWAEKLSGGRSRDVREYSSEKFMEHVRDTLDEHEDLGNEAVAEYNTMETVAKRVCARHGVEFEVYLAELLKGSPAADLEVDEDADDEIQFFGMQFPKRSPIERRQEIFDEARLHSDNEHEAFNWLQDNQEIFGVDYWDANLRDYNVHFLFACWAIALTIRLWREYEASPEALAHRNPGDSYVWVEGGLVQNNTSLPVFDTDVLDDDFPNQDSASEALDLYERIMRHPEASYNLSDSLDRAADFIRAYGSVRDIATLDSHEDKRLAGQPKERVA